MKILIADDDPVVRKILQRLLENLNHEVIVAKDGDEAWEMFQDDGVRLIIADWMMPGLSGLELFRRIREAPLSGYVYLIILSAKDAKKDMIKGLEAGADDYIIKPLDPEELTARMRSAERILRLEEELAAKNRELEEKNALLERMALTDPLTRVGNRRKMEEDLTRTHHTSQRYSRPYSLILTDIDHFKAYNDILGHYAGDMVLKKVAEILTRGIRSSDSVYRYGGEEFLILLPEQVLDGARATAERLRSTVERKGLVHRGNPPYGVVTLSFGVASHGPNHHNEGWRELINRADRALYTAKRTGRNRVEVSP